MISERLKRTILNELKVDEFEMNDDTTAVEVPGWDSLNHINVILAVEKEYNIRFKNVEVLRLKNLGELQSLVDTKTQA
jgi:acyl carrier protein